ncbi:MAG: nucleotide exchange factor GrpE [Clostridia bacterium]|nr:nucleotide exchange factor GrpE [Clostridia bacterium]
MAKKEKDIKTESTETTQPAVNESVEELEKLQAEYDALNDKYMRILAEYDNFRKRSQKDIESRVSYTKTDLLSKILPVVDNFERAAFNADADFDGYKKGIEMTVNQFLEILRSMGVESFGAAGESFDPNFHNGVMHIDDENFGENEIADVFMKGYKIGDKVIRPATVKVAN